MYFPIFVVYAMGVYELFKALKILALPKLLTSSLSRAITAFLLFTIPLVLSYLTGYS